MGDPVERAVVRTHNPRSEAPPFPSTCERNGQHTEKEGGLVRTPPPEEACAIARAHKRRSAQKAQEENGSSVA